MPWFPTPSRLRYIYESIRSRKALTHLIEALPYNIDDEPQSVAQMMLKKHMEPREIGQVCLPLLIIWFRCDTHAGLLQDHLLYFAHGIS